MLRTALAVLALAACGSRDDAKPSPAPIATPAVQVPSAPRDAFVRIPAEEAKGAYYQHAASGEIVGNMELVGDFVCKLTTRFGPADPFVYLFADDFPVLGFPVKHVATGTILVAYPKDYGYAGLNDKATEQIAEELDKLLARTKPADCEYTYSGFYRVDHSGVRDGKPFFEHVGFAQTLDMRRAQFAENDEHGGDRKRNVEEELCVVTSQNWSERTLPGPYYADQYATYPQREEVRVRLGRCVTAGLRRLEEDVEHGVFDPKDVVEEVDHALIAYNDLELRDPELLARIQKLRARFKRGPR